MSRAWHYQLAAALLLLFSLIVANPIVEAGMNDDWSFIFTVRNLASTGHLQYNAWSAPLIGFQAYWAALFVKLFGFSFLAVRSSAWVLAFLAIPVLWHLLRLVSLTQSQAFVALLLFQLSPLILPNLATFMTDMPAFWLFAAALLCALKAWHSNAKSSTVRWLVALTFFTILSGSVRQVYWMAGVCFLLTLAFLRIRSRRLWSIAAVCVASILAFGAAASYWLSHQPYVPADTTIAVLRQASWRNIFHTAGGDTIRNLLGLSVLSLPATLPLAWHQAKRLTWWIQLPILLAAIVTPWRLGNPVPFLGNTITNYGIIVSGTVSLGEKPVILSGTLTLLLASAGFASIAYAITCLYKDCRSAFAILTLPFLLLYTLVIAVRAPGFGLYDRYIIPHLFIISTVAFIAWTTRSHTVSPLTLAFGALFTLYSLATTHDYFAEARAKLQATQQVLASGVDRASIMSGFEFDSWTQLERAGHVNNSLVRFPPDAFHDVDDCNGDDDLQAWWRPLEPVLAARYVITLSVVNGAGPAPFPPVNYSRWLSPGPYYIYVEAIPPKDPPLTCKPENGN